MEGSTFNDSCSNAETMDVLRKIYDDCDVFSNDKVLVSKLVEFIKPYMGSNEDDLQILKHSLDPNDSDPEISSKVFYDVMNVWIKKCKQEDSFQNISPRNLGDPPLIESTPRKSFGARQLRVYAEAAALNISAVEKTSYIGTDSNETYMEKSILQEQNKQLAHQNKKFNEELHLARTQLNSQEEQNVLLQLEIENLTKELKHERENVQSLINMKHLYDDLRESSFNKQKNIDKLKKEMLHLEKENQLLQSQKDDLEREKQSIDDKMNHIHEKLSESRKEVIELRAEVRMKEEQLEFTEDVNKQLLTKIDDLKHQSNNLEEVNTCLTIEKEKVAKLLQDSLKIQSKAVLNYTPQTQESEYNANVTQTGIVTKPHTPTHAKKAQQASHITQFQENLKLLKYFMKSTDSLQSPSSTLSNTQNSSTSTRTQRYNTIKPKTVFAEDNYKRQRSLGDSNSPIPFASPIKTSKFTFYNIDSPIAKCRAMLQSKSSDTKESPIRTKLDINVKPSPPVSNALVLYNSKSPNTPTDTALPPTMYVVDRTNHRKSTVFNNATLDESGNEEELLQVVLSSSVSSAQASLMDEIAALSSPSSIMGSERSCSKCNANYEIKSRLDDLCEQIDWLKSENSGLKQAEDKFVELLQSKQLLENDIRKRDEIIEILQKNIDSMREKEAQLLAQCAEMKENVSKQNDIKEKWDEGSKEIVILQDKIKTLEEEMSKLEKGCMVDKAMISRLKSDHNTLESAKKCLEMKIINLQAEKNTFTEKYQNVVDEYSKIILQYKDDIHELEVKFYSTNDELTSLVAQNEELSSNSKRVYSLYQKLTEVHEELQVDYNFYVTTINKTSTSEMPTRQKLQELVIAQTEYGQLKQNVELLTDEHCKQTDALKSRIAELDKLYSQAVHAKNTSTRIKGSHDRTQIKMEKLHEKIDYLQDIIKNERITQSNLKQEIEILEKSNKCLTNEKYECLKNVEDCKDILLEHKNSYSELSNGVNKLINGSVKVRHTMLKLSKTWSNLFEHIDSIDYLLNHLGETTIDDLCTQFENIGSVSTIEGSITKRKQDNICDISKAMDNLQTVSSILDALSACDVNNVIDDIASNVNCQPRELKILKQLGRPMSPDSPNLEMECVLSFDTIDTTLSLEDHDAEDDVFIECLQELQSIYRADSLDFLLTRCKLEDDEISSSDLKNFVDEFVLTFLIDCSGYKNRIQAQFEVVREVMTRLVENLRSFRTLRNRRDSRNRFMKGIVRCLFELTKAAERYGAIQQEIHSSRVLQRLIAYISNLRESAGTKTFGGNLHTETVYRASVTTIRSSNTMNESSQSRFMCLLHMMRPTNVIRLVGATALTFLIYYFSQRFISVLAPNSHREGCSEIDLRGNSICWQTWLDFMAACFGRVVENRHPEPF